MFIRLVCCSFEMPDASIHWGTTWVKLISEGADVGFKFGVHAIGRVGDVPRRLDRSIKWKSLYFQCSLMALWMLASWIACPRSCLKRF